MEKENTLTEVSVIIPVYNVAPYLREALDSVVNQTYSKLEILIIDDGSTDGSGEICDEYKEKDNRIRVIHQDNHGLSTARNVGLDLMTGDVVAFLDSDDAYDLDFIKLMLEALNREKADCVVCRFIHQYTTKRMKVTGRKKIRSQVSAGSYGKVFSLNAIVDGRINISSWNKMYKRELWNEIRFPDGHVFEEQNTILEIFNLCNRVYIMDRPLYLYRKRPGSISDTISLSNMNDLVLAYSYVEMFAKKHSPEIISQSQIESVQKRKIDNYISVYARSSRKKGNEWSVFNERLKKQIIEMAKDVNGLELRTKVVIGIMSNVPALMQFVYPIYRSIRLVQYKVF